MPEICQTHDDAYSELTDDPTIHNEDVLWRRIHPRWVKPDEKIGGVRLTSEAFQNSSDGSPMSVVLAKEHGNPEAVLEGHEGYSLASITACLARENCQGIARDPTQENPAHALVFGKKTEATSKKLARGAEWVVPPPPP